ncbi:MAG: hypothetical protein M3N05_02080 [Pseudomonadota bacterium]|nr:hypothetical protein [Pseudomonadota bacterium]
MRQAGVAGQKAVEGGVISDAAAPDPPDTLRYRAPWDQRGKRETARDRRRLRQESSASYEHAFSLRAGGLSDEAPVT